MQGAIAEGCAGTTTCTSLSIVTARRRSHSKILCNDRVYFGFFLQVIKDLLESLPPRA